MTMSGMKEIPLAEIQRRMLSNDGATLRKKAAAAERRALITVIDVERCMERNPLLASGSVVSAPFLPTEPITVLEDGVEQFRIEATDKPITTALDDAHKALLLEQCGDLLNAPKVDEEKGAKPALVYDTQAKQWRRGSPDEAQTAKDAREVETVRARNAELQRPNAKAFAELGLEGLIVGGAFGRSPPGPLCDGRTPSCALGADRVFYWRSVPGLSLPPDLNFDGCRTAPRSLVLPVPSAQIESQEITRYPSDNLFGMIEKLRRQFVPGCTARVPDDRWSTEGVPIVEALIAEWIDLVRNVRNGLAWVPRHAVALSVRGALVAPPVVARMWFDELYVRFAIDHGFTRKPKARREIDMNAPSNPAAQFHRDTRTSRLGTEDVNVDFQYRGLTLDALAALANEAAHGISTTVEIGALLPPKQLNVSKKGGK